MKIEDMKFPIKVELEDKEMVYKISFNGHPWLDKCCDSKLIKGRIDLKKIPKVIKGFKFNENIEEWGHGKNFVFCPICGKEEWCDNKSRKIDIVREAWLKTIKNYERIGLRPKPSKNKRRRK